MRTVTRTLRRLAPAVLLLAAVAVCGCRYRVGTLMHPQLKTVGLGDFGNETVEPGLEQALRTQLVEQFTTDGSLRPVGRGAADFLVEGRIVDVTTRQVASVKRRDDSDLDEDRDAYQASVFRTTVQVEFRAVVPGRAEPLLTAATVTGTADYSRLPDLSISRDGGVRRALHDASKQIVTAVSEAW